MSIRKEKLTIEKYTVKSRKEKVKLPCRQAGSRKEKVESKMNKTPNIYPVYPVNVILFTGVESRSEYSIRGEQAFRTGSPTQAADRHAGEPRATRLHFVTDGQASNEKRETRNEPRVTSNEQRDER
jgi:hypothetical protein